MKIKELCEAERPREKMLSAGPGALSNGELLAVILRSGTRSMSAIDLAQELMKKVDGSLCRLATMSPAMLCGIEGIKNQKAAGILASLELGRRMMCEAGTVEKRPVTRAKTVFEIMRPYLKGLDHEECWILFLNRSNYITGRQKVSSGDDYSTIMNTKEIVRRCLEKHASALIMVHNHPSGNPHPSDADIRRTEALHDALHTFEIDLLDHVIVCDDCFFSFSEE